MPCTETALLTCQQRWLQRESGAEPLPLRLAREWRRPLSTPHWRLRSISVFEATGLQFAGGPARSAATHSSPAHTPRPGRTRKRAAPCIAFDCIFICEAPQLRLSPHPPLISRLLHTPRLLLALIFIYSFTAVKEEEPRFTLAVFRSFKVQCVKLDFFYDFSIGKSFTHCHKYTH